MEKPKQKLIKILIIVNLVISTCTAIGVGYIAYKQSTIPNFPEIGQKGIGQMFPGNGQFQPNQHQLDQTQ